MILRMQTFKEEIPWELELKILKELFKISREGSNLNSGSEFITQQVIAYIGNKRGLLDLIDKAIKTTMPDVKPGLRFLDLFAGSGIVSRFAKESQFEVFTNDWEFYSFILNGGFVKTNKKDISEIFESEENFFRLLDHLNNLSDPPNDQTYIAKYYAPKSFNNNEVDFKTERLFYTRQNALIIDKIRNYIDTHYPPVKNTPSNPLNSSDEKKIRARDLLLSILLYEAATHTNTSGVFKAFHKGFGGHNGDAIKRITSPIKMRAPNLINSDYPIHLYKEDANDLVKKLRNIDIAYLDPPYNQHQYGSNYHMLNTISLWDKIPAPMELNDKGVLKEKAAIRKDWITTRSNYCYRISAISSFSDLIENLNAKRILISYSTDGIIPFEIMKQICTKKGEISIVTNEYTKYRGGKQSNKRLNTNIEFILVIDCEKVSTSDSIKKVDWVIAMKRLLLMFKQKYSYSKIKVHSLSISEGNVVFGTGKRELIIPTKFYFELFPVEEIADLSLNELEYFYEILLDCACLSKEEELEEILFRLEENLKKGVDIKISRYFIKMIPDTLKKLAHKKNKERFYYWLKKIKKLEQKNNEIYLLIKEKINSIEIVAKKRFEN